MSRLFSISAFALLLAAIPMRTAATDKNEGPPALWLAADTGDADAVRELLKTDKKPDDQRFKHGSTPLMRACFRGHLKIVQMLLEAGADPNSTARTSETPLTFAADGGRLKVAIVLVEKGADVQHASDGGWTVLHHACTYAKNKEFLALLIDHGANKNARTDLGFSPLMNAATIGDVAAVEFLIAKDANLSFREFEGLTALGLAKRSAMKTRTSEKRSRLEKIIMAITDVGGHE